MEAGNYGLTRGTCFVSRNLPVVAVAGLLWLSWCVLGGAEFFRGFFRFFFFERTRRAASTRPHLASCTSLLVVFFWGVRMYHGYVPGIISLQAIRDGAQQLDSTVPLRTGTAVRVLFSFLPSRHFFVACVRVVTTG